MKEGGGSLLHCICRNTVMQKYGVSRGTARQALVELRRDGLVC
ncbi:MAG TPA: GntR family transcriptional regulator [Candidatus Marinimicrobia bacterium]|nr:GntR family transcriptional regulator [Candidatus Neomarinimicrobiota bacterium]